MIFFITTNTMFSIQRNKPQSLAFASIWMVAPSTVYNTARYSIYKASRFDHVRLPVMKNNYGTKILPKTQAFADMHACIQWCIALDLRVVVDMIFAFASFQQCQRGYDTWETQEQDYMMEIWRILSAELKHYSEDMLAYEFMNEPVLPSITIGMNWWHGHSVIRELEFTRTLIFGGMANSQVFESFEIPRGDANIILSFHTYDPLPFTLQAPWMPLSYHQCVVYPGTTVPDEFYKIL